MKRLSGSAKPAITVDLEGDSVPAVAGEPVACSLLAADEPLFARSIKYHRPRGPYCFAAACSQCLMRVDGVPNVYTCQTPARPGMKLERQNAYPSVKVDVFGAIDWLFPNGLDHHEMFAGVPVADQVMAKVARHLAGLGLLPTKAPAPRLAAETVRTRVVVVGGGAAGLAAASSLERARIPFVLVERSTETGGRHLSGAPEADAPDAPVLKSNAPVRLRTAAIGLFDDADGRYIAAVQELPSGPRLLKLYADRFVVAVGGHPAVWPFANNDLPGVFAGRAVSQLIRRHGVLVGKRVAVVGWGAELKALGALLEAQGAAVPLLLELGEKAEVVSAHGRGRVSALSVRVAGKLKKVKCDAVAVSLPPSPGFELPRQGGARVSFHEGHQAFIVEADADGRTRADDLYVAGDVAGPSTLRAASVHGARVGDAVARSLK